MEYNNLRPMCIHIDLKTLSYETKLFHAILFLPFIDFFYLPNKPIYHIKCNECDP